MTTEEAIKRIENHMEAQKTRGYFSLNLNEALNMAITALRAQTDFNGTYINIAWLKQVEAERDAAVKDLTRVCENNPDVCDLCKHFPCAPEHPRCLGWKWRGINDGKTD